MSEPTVVDLSHWQPDVDFQKLADNGVLAVILKCTEGTTYTDDSFSSHREKAIEAGLAYASYHFLKHGNATAQMNFYLDTLEPRHGERLCIDYEDEDCTLDDLHTAVQTLLNHNHETGQNLQITVYSGHLLKEQLQGTYDALLDEHTSLWVAHYTHADQPTWPGGTYKTWSLWQYSDSVDVGDYGPLDGNRFNGSDDMLLDWIGPAGETRRIERKESEEIPEIEITLRSSSPVMISIVTDDNVTIV
jgi:lysozyme